MHAPAIRSPPHLVIELVGRELESRKHVGGSGDGTQHRSSGATGQLDVDPLRRLPGTSFLSDVDIDAVALAIELFQPFQPGLRAVAEPSTNGRVVGPDDDIHPGVLLT
ncbi:MAG TPA: hypothetical protein VHW74_01210 [Mycobacteriales bacterium]|jgi:hypothetical protein|nr:hypothetical protein [Mycobacteriales bacterium]